MNDSEGFWDLIWGVCILIILVVVCISAVVLLSDYIHRNDTIYDNCIRRCPVTNSGWVSLDCPTYCEKFIEQENECVYDSTTPYVMGMCESVVECAVNMNLTGCYQQDMNIACCNDEYCEIVPLQKYEEEVNVPTTDFPLTTG